MKTERERQLEAAVGECYRILDEAIYPPGMRPPDSAAEDAGGGDVNVEEVVAWAAMIDSMEGVAGGSPSERAIVIAHAILDADPAEASGEGDY